MEIDFHKTLLNVKQYLSTFSSTPPNIFLTAAQMVTLKLSPEETAFNVKNSGWLFERYSSTQRDTQGLCQC